MHNILLASKHVVLVNSSNEKLGILDKFLAHNDSTPLHRGFSTFVFNSKNEFLIQKRAATKKTWPNFWSNSFCGHPQLDETNEQAIGRHGLYELNLKNLDNLKLIRTYQYTFSYNNIVENEICPIYMAVTNDKVEINPQEVSETRWLAWNDFKLEIKKSPNNFTPWCIEEAAFIDEALT